MKTVGTFSLPKPRAEMVPGTGRDTKQNQRSTPSGRCFPLTTSHAYASYSNRRYFTIYICDKHALTPTAALVQCL